MNIDVMFMWYVIDKNQMEISKSIPIYKMEKINKELAMFGVDHNLNITDPPLKIPVDNESIVHHDHCKF